MIEPFFHREYAKSLTADALKHIVEKVARADYAYVNDSSLLALREFVAGVLQDLRG